MIRLATVIDTFEAEFLAAYGQRMHAGQRQALTAMKRCRTQSARKMQIQCDGCAHQALVPHSCGHRLCPHCQHHESEQWLERQLARQVPANYFLLTFTLPAELRPLCWSHQRLVYDLLLRASWDTVRTFSENDKQLRGMPGAIAVLHTNTRRLDYHPHVHLVMPAAAVDAGTRQWRTRQGRKAGYLFSHKALAKVFRAKVLAGLAASGLAPPGGYPRQWVVDCKAVGSGAKALVYLGRYLYRGVIREKDIVACDEGWVTFRFQNAKTGKPELRTVPGAQFLWLILQHTLPKGLRRARNFGFLHANCKRLIALLHVLLKYLPPQRAPMRQRPQFKCPCCGNPMRVMTTRLRARMPTAPAAGAVV